MVSECGTKGHDVVFIVDISSSGVGNEDNFGDIRNVMMDIIRKLDIGAGTTKSRVS